MKKLLSIPFLVLVPLILTTSNFAQDFKIAPNTILPDGSNPRPPITLGSNCFNVSVDSDPSNGFLVTWINRYWDGNNRHTHNYACRVSKTGEIMDSVAVFLWASSWSNYCPDAVFAGGNWIIANCPEYMLEHVGVQRLTPSGTLLDTIPVNVLPSSGYATLFDPVLATNGKEILCLAGVNAESLYASIFDPSLHVLVPRFGLFPKTHIYTRAYRAASNGDNFYVTFSSWNPEDPGIKLIVVRPDGAILATQNVGGGSFPTVTVVDDTIYVNYFLVYGTTTLMLRRYDSGGSPIDSKPIAICELQDFDTILFQHLSSNFGYVDIVFENGSFFLFWPRVASPWPTVTSKGLTVIRFQPGLLRTEMDSLDSQCQIMFHLPDYETSYSLIRTSSIDGNVLTAWIDGREGKTRVYGNFVEVDEYTNVESNEDQMIVPEDVSIFQNYPNPFNPSTTISYALPRHTHVTLSVFNTLGQQVATLVNSDVDAGYHEAKFDAHGLASGVYLYRLQAGGYVETKKFILLR